MKKVVYLIALLCSTPAIATTYYDRGEGRYDVEVTDSMVQKTSDITISGVPEGAKLVRVIANKSTVCGFGRIADFRRDQIVFGARKLVKKYKALGVDSFIYPIEAGTEVSRMNYTNGSVMRVVKLDDC